MSIIIEWEKYFSIDEMKNDLWEYVEKSSKKMILEIKNNRKKVEYKNLYSNKKELCFI
jgi:hypothetical protein